MRTKNTPFFTRKFLAEANAMLLSALEACKIHPKGGIDENYSYLGYVMVDVRSTISLPYWLVAQFSADCVFELV